MSLFLRLLEDEDKALALRTALHAVATGAADPRVFGVVVGRRSTVVSRQSSVVSRQSSVVGRRSSVVGRQSRLEIAGAVCSDLVCLAND
jgi:hypothetical protein